MVWKRRMEDKSRQTPARRSRLGEEKEDEARSGFGILLHLLLNCSWASPHPTFFFYCHGQRTKGRIFNFRWGRPSSFIFLSHSLTFPFFLSSIPFHPYPYLLLSLFSSSSSTPLFPSPHSSSLYLPLHSTTLPS